jgi:hypothetical protein
MLKHSCDCDIHNGTEQKLHSIELLFWLFFLLKHVLSIKKIFLLLLTVNNKYIFIMQYKLVEKINRLQDVAY